MLYRTTTTTVVTGALLAGCSAAPPVELSEDAVEAARTCFVAKGLTLREDKAQDDAVTYDEFVASIRYPMIAAAERDDFAMSTVIDILNGTENVAETLGAQDYAGAAATCNERFPGEPLALPESDSGAILACTAMASFVAGAIEGESDDFGGDGAKISALQERLGTALEGDAELLMALAGGEGEALMMSQLRTAFAQGDPDGYIDRCDARFPVQ
ncbi:MAG: hypothetical protein WA954_00495 [Parerythrobacter sp.]